MLCWSRKNFPYECKVSVDAEEHIFHGGRFNVLHNTSVLIRTPMSISFCNESPFSRFRHPKLGRKVSGGFCMIGSNTMKIGIWILLSESIFLKYLIYCICIRNRTSSLLKTGWRSKFSRRKSKILLLCIFVLCCFVVTVSLLTGLLTSGCKFSIH